MKLDRKLELAKQAVASISRHDDAPAQEVSDTLKRLGRFMAEEERDARTRRRNRGEAGNWLTYLWRQLNG